MRTIARFHPFLILAGITLVVTGLTFLLEGPVSYDDGAVGSLIFALWLFFLWPVRMVQLLGSNLGVQRTGPAYFGALVILLLAYVWLDRRLTRWGRMPSGGAA